MERISVKYAKKWESLYLKEYITDKPGEGVGPKFETIFIFIEIEKCLQANYKGDFSTFKNILDTILLEIATSTIKDISLVLAFKLRKKLIFS